MALGCIEVPFVSISLMLADYATKFADVQLLGLDTTGNENIMIRLSGDVASLDTAMIGVSERAEVLGVNAITNVISGPDKQLDGVHVYPNYIIPLFDGREQFLPTDYQGEKKMSKRKLNAIGILETQGLTAVLEASDAMFKAADVKLVCKEKIGAAYVSVIIEGDVAAVQAAIEAGSQAVGNLGKLIAAHVISRPHEEVSALLPN